MNRRRAISGLLASAAAVTSSRARAQQAKPFRIAGFPNFAPITRRILSDVMREVGWTEGTDFIIVQSGFEFGAPDPDEAARRTVAGNPDVILTIATSYALALHRATTSIPIVMVSCGYPVEAGLAISLAKPGKNVTGNSLYAGVEVWGKLIELLAQVKPGVKHIGILWAYTPPAFPREEIEPCYTELRNAEHLLGLKLSIIEIANTDQVPAALAQISAERPEALLLTGGLSLKSTSTIMEFAVDKGLPTIIDYGWVLGEPSPLLSYSPVYEELARTAVLSIIKILKGAKPGDLPIQQPSRFELTVNLKTAKAIGLSIPQELLWRADRVVE
jgi:putative ABC transport system substrate-binding protein